MVTRLRSAKESLESFLANAGFMLGMTFAAPTTMRLFRERSTPRIDAAVGAHEISGFVGGNVGAAPAVVLVSSAVMSLNPLYALPVVAGQTASLIAEVIGDRYFSRSQNGEASM